MKLSSRAKRVLVVMTLPRALRFVVPLALLASLATPAFAATSPPGVAAPSTSPQLLDVQLSETAVTVSGLEWHDVSVRLHLTSAKGIIQTNDTQGFSYPSVRFERTTAGRGQVAYAPNTPSFTLASGNAEDGWWEGVVHVTAGYDGAFTVTSVFAYQSDYVELAVDPRTLGIDADVQVTGVNIPHLTIQQSPNPVQNGSTLTLSGTLTGADTGLPLSGVGVAIMQDTPCSEMALGGGGLPTAADGGWRGTFPKWDTGLLSCAFVTAVHARSLTDDGIAEYVGMFNLDVNFREWVGARLASSRVRVGRTVAVTGTSSAIGGPLSLQRQAGGTWHTVGKTSVRSSGTFTLLAQPPARGTYRYRVLHAPTRDGELPATSSVMTLVAR